MKKNLLILLMFISCLSGFSQEVVPPTNDNITYTITSIDVQIQGMTQRFALLNILDLHENRKIIGTENWNHFFELKKNLLANQRIFERAEITADLKDSVSGKSVYITIKIKDGFNIIALPYPKYSSDDGLTLALKTRDYNFLGTMQPFRLDLNYIINKYSQQGYGFSNDGNLPFQAFDNDFNIDYAQELKIVTDQPTYYAGTGGFSFIKTLGESTITFRAYQGVNFNNPDSDDNIVDWYYLTTGSYIGSNNPLGLYVGPFGELTYYNTINIEKTYRLNNELLNDDQKHFNVWYAHGLTFGSINWDGNFRKGWKVDLNNVLGKKLYEDQAALIPYYKTVDFSNVIATNWGWAGFSTRLTGFYNFDEIRKKVGVYLRGIIDDRISAYYGWAVNFDLPIRIIDFKPSEWFNKPCYKPFEFELQVSPFFDMGAFGMKQTGWEGQPWFTAGLEAFFFPGFSKSFFMRVSYGVELWSAMQLKSISGYSLRTDDNYGDNDSNVKIREIALGMVYFY